jgi:hypothetical protein
MIMLALGRGLDVTKEMPLTSDHSLALLTLFANTIAATGNADGNQSVVENRSEIKHLSLQLTELLKSFDSLLAHYESYLHPNLLDRRKRLNAPKSEELKQEGSMLIDRDIQSMIQSGRFGVEIEEFSMLLPVNYPLLAGEARYALKPALLLYQEILQKLRHEALPNTWEQVYTPSLRERWEQYFNQLTHKQQREYRKQLFTLIHKILQTKHIQDIAYLSRRRTTYHKLPALSSHYPNTHYPVQALVTSETDYVSPDADRKSLYAAHDNESEALSGKSKSTGHRSSDKFSMQVFGRSVINAVVVPPVGRRPNKLQMFQLQNEVYESQSLKSVEKVKANEHQHHSSHHHRHRHQSQHKHEQQQQHHGSSPSLDQMSIHSHHSHSHSHTNTTAGVTANDIVIPKEKLKPIRKEISSTLESSAAGSLLTKKQPSQAELNKQKSSRRFANALVQYPQSFYRHRRGFFGTLPGLQEFIVDTQGSGGRGGVSQRDNVGDETVDDKDMKEEAIASSKDSDNGELSVGLLQRFRIRVSYSYICYDIVMCINNTIKYNVCISYRILN